MNIFKKTASETEYLLSEESIDKASLEIEKHLKELGLDKSDIIKIRLLAESELLEYKDNLPPQSKFSLVFYREMGREHVSVEIPGQKFEFKNTIEESFYHKLINSIDESKIDFSYQYTNKINFLDYALPKKKKNAIFYTLIALCAAIATTLICSLFPKEVGQYVSKKLFSPLIKVITGVLGMASLLMIFFNIICGVCALGNINTFKKQGRLIFKQFCGRTFFETIIFTIITLSIFPILETEGKFNVGIFNEVFSNLIAIIPTNIVNPFLTGNSLHVLVLGVAVGLLLLSNKNNSNELITITNQLNINTMTAISKICSLMPVVVYLSVSILLLNGEYGMLIETWKVVALCYGLHIFRFIWLNIYLGKKLNKSCFQLMKENMTITLLAFFTTSSAACTDLVINHLEKEYKMPKEESDFYFPMFQMFYKPSVTVLYVSFIYGMCYIYGIPQSLSTIVLNCFIFPLLAFSAAPMPGGKLPLIILLINSAGLPIETLAIYSSVDILFDMIGTASKMCFATSEIAWVKKRMEHKSV